MRIIDAHVHLGDKRETKFFDLAELEKNLNEAGAAGAVVFAFPEDMYRISDTPERRAEANRYVLEARLPGKTIYPFYYVWNDYALPEDLSAYAGIKWHRHWDEPRYDYDDERCRKVLGMIAELGLPVTLEEEFEPTQRFIAENPGITVIIPHTGRLNGGTERMTAFFDNEQVYFDTSTAAVEEIRCVLDRVGAERVIFGSDVSGTREPFFNFPKVERAKIEAMGLSEMEAEMIFAENIERIVRHDRR